MSNDNNEYSFDQFNQMQAYLWKIRLLENEQDITPRPFGIHSFIKEIKPLVPAYAANKPIFELLQKLVQRRITATETHWLEKTDRDGLDNWLIVNFTPAVDRLRELGFNVSTGEAYQNLAVELKLGGYHL